MLPQTLLVSAFSPGSQTPSSPLAGQKPVSSCSGLARMADRCPRAAALAAAMSGTWGELWTCVESYRATGTAGRWAAHRGRRGDVDPREHAKFWGFQAAAEIWLV